MTIAIPADAATRDAESSRRRASLGLAIAFAVLSFVIYAACVLVLHQQQKNTFLQERSSLAAAVSNVAYGASLGRVHKGLLDYFLDFRVPLETALAQSARREVNPGYQLASTADGNGIGYIVVASLSMRMFGLHTWSPVLLMLSLMALSAIAFLARFRERRAAVVVLYFTTLTVMLFTPLVWHADYAKELAIGGIRYLSVLAILPAFHLLMECTEVGRYSTSFRTSTVVAAGIQVAIFLIAVLVRNSAMPLAAAIAVGCVIVAWRRRRNRAEAREALRKGLWIAVMAGAFVALLMLLSSKAYLTEGRFTETVWHRIFVSLGLHPEFPFGNLRQVYDCTKYIPSGLVNGAEDQNGHCVVLAYALTHGIHIDWVPRMTYGRYYDNILRWAFFDVLRAYPRQTLETIFVIKGKMIWTSIAESFDFKLAAGAAGAALWCLLAAALANLLAYAVLMAPGLAAIGSIAATSLLFAAFSIPSYLAGWARPYTSSDLFFFCVLAPELLAVLVAAQLSILLQARSPRPKPVPLA